MAFDVKNFQSGSFDVKNLYGNSKASYSATEQKQLDAIRKIEEQRKKMASAKRVITKPSYSIPVTKQQEPAKPVASQDKVKSIIAKETIAPSLKTPSGYLSSYQQPYSYLGIKTPTYNNEMKEAIADPKEFFASMGKSAWAGAVQLGRDLVSYVEYKNKQQWEQMNADKGDVFIAPKPQAKKPWEDQYVGVKSLGDVWKNFETSIVNNFNDFVEDREATASYKAFNSYANKVLGTIPETKSAEYGQMAGAGITQSVVAGLAGEVAVPLLFLNSLDSTIQQMRSEGIDLRTGRATARAVATAGIEVGTEYMFNALDGIKGASSARLSKVGWGTKLLGKLETVNGVPKNVANKFAKEMNDFLSKEFSPTIAKGISYMTRHGNEEGIEELASQLGSNVIRFWTTNPEMTAKDVFNPGQLAYSYGAGFILGSVISAVHGGGTFVLTRKTAQKIQDKPLEDVTIEDATALYDSLQEDMKTPENMEYINNVVAYSQFQAEEAYLQAVQQEQIVPPTKEVLSTKSSTGEVFAIGDKVYKNAVFPRTGNLTEESAIYDMLSSSNVISDGKLVEIDGKKYVETPRYEHVISIDTIAQNDRKSLSDLVYKNVDRINLAMQELINNNINYHDPLQFGLKDGKFYLIDFSNASIAKDDYDKRYVMNDNFDYLSNFYNEFGLQKLGKIISTSQHLIGLITSEPEFRKGWYDDKYINAFNFPIEINPNNIYYSTNARPIEVGGIIQSDPIDGVKYIYSETPIKKSVLDTWEIKKIYEQQQPSPIETAQAKPTYNTVEEKAKAVRKVVRSIKDVGAMQLSQEQTEEQLNAILDSEEGQVYVSSFKTSKDLADSMMALRDNSVEIAQEKGCG